MVRLDDWVTQVRDVATGLGNRVASELTTTDLAGWAAEIVALVSRARAVKNPALTRILQRLSEPEGLSSLGMLMRSESLRLRRGALKLLIEMNVIASTPHLVSDGLAAHDAFVRVRVAQVLLESGSGAAVSRVIPSLLADGSPRIRSAALRWLIDNNPIQASTALNNALLDPAFSVRELAIFYVKQRRDSDLAQFYRDALSQHLDAPMTRAVLFGLAATTTSDQDQRSIASWIGDGRNSVARAALQALLRWPVRNNAKTFLDATLSVHRKLSMRATAALLGDATLAAPILDRLQGSQLPHHRLNALLLRLRTADKWLRLELLLNAVDQDDELVGHATNQLQSWLRGFNRSYASLTQDHLTSIHRLLKSVSSKLDQELALAIAQHATPLE